jgi:hypothetical protein
MGPHQRVPACSERAARPTAGCGSCLPSARRQRQWQPKRSSRPTGASRSSSRSWCSMPPPAQGGPERGAVIRARQAEGRHPRPAAADERKWWLCWRKGRSRTDRHGPTRTAKTTR